MNPRMNFHVPVVADHSKGLLNVHGYFIHVVHLGDTSLVVIPFLTNDHHWMLSIPGTMYIH